jgi:hypothetical protein
MNKKLKVQYNYTLSQYVKVRENMQKTIFLTLVLHGVFKNWAFRNSHVLVIQYTEVDIIVS